MTARILPSYCRPSHGGDAVRNRATKMITGSSVSSKSRRNSKSHTRKPLQQEEPTKHPQGHASAGDWNPIRMQASGFLQLSICVEPRGPASAKTSLRSRQEIFGHRDLAEPCLRRLCAPTATLEPSESHCFLQLQPSPVLQHDLYELWGSEHIVGFCDTKQANVKHARHGHVEG